MEKVANRSGARRDRLARPQDPLEAMQIERAICRAGVTIIFSDSVAPPLELGQNDIVRDITQLVAYHQSREWLESHAEKIIAAQQQLARQGFSTGRRPVHGFARFLVGPDGSIGERLAAGRGVRQPGYHVAILPDDREKLGHILLMVDTREQGWGFKRIARYLTDLGIPSPAAGETRTDNGQKHRVSGVWHPNTVANLLRNPLVIGVLEYGRRSEGKLRRQSSNGPRRLLPEELDSAERPRVVVSDKKDRIEAKTSAKPVLDLDRWQKLQEQMDARGASQRGIPRSKNPARWPLAGRLTDLTGYCGHPMYGRFHGKRAIYVCGRYWKTGGAQCDNNTLDAEATLRFVVSTIRQLLWTHGSPAKVEQLLRERAQRLPGGFKEQEAALTAQFERRTAELREQLDTVQHHMARERDDDTYAGLAAEFRKIKGELDAAESELDRHHRATLKKRPTNPEADVEAAMAFLRSFEHAVTDRSARAGINPLLRALGVMVGFRFVSAIKGRKRVVRRLDSGVMAFGNHPLPVPLYGRDNVKRGDCGACSTAVHPSIKHTQSELRNPQDGPAGLKCPGEDVSFQKVNRGDSTLPYMLLYVQSFNQASIAAGRRPGSAHSGMRCRRYACCGCRRRTVPIPLSQFCWSQSSAANRLGRRPAARAGCRRPRRPGPGRTRPVPVVLAAAGSGRRPTGS